MEGEGRGEAEGGMSFLPRRRTTVCVTEGRAHSMSRASDLELRHVSPKQWLNIVTAKEPVTIISFAHQLRR